MPSSARIRAALRNTAATLVAIIAVLGIADTTAAASTVPPGAQTAAVQAAGTMGFTACGACGSGF